MTSQRRSRWALSFADLCLLLLGFFVLLESQRQAGHTDPMAGLSAYFSGSDETSRTARLDMEIPASELFVPQEAMLAGAGHTRLDAIARKAAMNGMTLRLTSWGTDPATPRFDGWDLASARLGAVARALADGGLGADSIRIDGPDSGDGSGKDGQIIAIRAMPVAKR